MFYLGLELSSIPLAAMANFDLDKRRSSEAAMKFIMSSAFSSGLLLFGISLLYGATGTLNFAELSSQLTTVNSLTGIFIYPVDCRVWFQNLSSSFSSLDSRCV